jgi:hypothetical protein
MAIRTTIRKLLNQLLFKFLPLPMFVFSNHPRSCTRSLSRNDFKNYNKTAPENQARFLTCPPPVFSSMYRITIDTEGRDPFSQGFACNQGGSLKRLHRPNRFRGGCLSLKGGEGIRVMVTVDPDYLNADLMKPRRGFTLAAGKKKLGVGKRSLTELRRDGRRKMVVLGPTLGKRRIPKMTRSFRADELHLKKTRSNRSLYASCVRGSRSTPSPGNRLHRRRKNQV